MGTRCFQKTGILIRDGYMPNPRVIIVTETYTHHNSKFRFSENILGPSLKVTQSPILAILCVLLWVGSIATSKYDPSLLPEKTKFRIAMGIDQ